jgi:hypothetical protein
MKWGNSDSRRVDFARAGQVDWMLQGIHLVRESVLLLADPDDHTKEKAGHRARLFPFTN